MSRTDSVRDQEYADIRRWFSQSDFGTLFHGDDGRAWPMARDVAARWEREAQTVVDEFLAGERAQIIVGGALCAGVMILGAVVSAKFGVGAHSGAFGVGAFALAHFWSLYCLWWHTRQVRALRHRIVVSLAATAPYAAEIGEPRRRTNPWRTALHVWVAVLVSLALGAMGWEDYMQPIMIALLIGVAIAWLLYGAAERTDFLQRQADFRRDTNARRGATALRRRR